MCYTFRTHYIPSKNKSWSDSGENHIKMIIIITPCFYWRIALTCFNGSGFDIFRFYFVDFAYFTEVCLPHLRANAPVSDWREGGENSCDRGRQISTFILTSRLWWVKQCVTEKEMLQLWLPIGRNNISAVCITGRRGSSLISILSLFNI